MITGLFHTYIVHFNSENVCAFCDRPRPICNRLLSGRPHRSGHLAVYLFVKYQIGPADPARPFMWGCLYSRGRSFLFEKSEDRRGLKASAPLGREGYCRPVRFMNISETVRPLEIESWFQRTTNRKWHMGYRMVR